MRDDISRCGGDDDISTDTDPSNTDYSHSNERPLNLHAFNGRNGRALLGGVNRDHLGARAKPSSLLPISPTQVKPDFYAMLVWAVIDSGCSWHCHPYADDLINTRPCNDTMTGIDGKPQSVTCIGDLPALTRDHLGTWKRIIIRNVRCVPTFSDTLISVDQFWQDSKVDTLFNSTRCLAVPASGEEPSLDLPFDRKENLYKWAILPWARISFACATK